jgi:hypothetical protein
MPTDFPESPDPVVPDLLRRLIDRHPAGTRQQPHRGHAGEVIGEIAARTGDPQSVRSRSMQAHLRCLAQQGLAIRAELVLHIAEQVIERRISKLERALATFDEAGEITRHHDRSQTCRLSLALALFQVFGVGKR